MQNPNLPAGQQPPPGPPGAPQQMTKEQKRAEAEKQKRIQQEKLRASELTQLIGTFAKTLSGAVIDTPMMCKVGCNSFKTMMRSDHCIIGLFKEFPESGQICVVEAEAAGTKEPPKPPAPPPPPKGQPAPPPPPEPPPPDPTKPPPKPAMPTHAPKPGTLLPVNGFWLEMPFIFNMKETKQPVIIPDASKFPEPQLNQFAAAFGIKSMLAMPMLQKNEMQGVVISYTINAFQMFSQVEVSHMQKAIAILVKAIETAPPNLPDELKKKVINRINKAEDSKKVIEYYSSMLEDVYNYIIGELDESEDTKKDAEDLRSFLDDRKKEEAPMRKVWFQLAKFLEFDGDKLEVAKIALKENFTQSEEYATEKDINPPPGLKLLIKYLRTMKKNPGIEQFGIPEETIATVDEDIDKAVRGQLLYRDELKANLINDIEQSEMISNFVSIPATIDFRQHIKAAMEETDIPEELEVNALLDDLCYAGMKEIVKSVAQTMAEKYLFELPDFLEQPETVQLTQTEALTRYIQRRLMANLVGTLKGKSTDWSKSVVEKLREKSKEAARKRAVMIGKIISQQEGDEDDE